MRVCLLVEYEGTNYAGWQRQDNAVAVQQVLEEAVRKLTGRAVTIIGAGRTDAGVHALGQCAHFDVDSAIPAQKMSFALNGLLPADIRVRASREAPGDFHARKSAKGKHYRYTVWNGIHDTALYRRTCAHVRYPLDVQAMCKAAAHIVGEHDFACFQAAGSTPVKSTVRTLYQVSVQRQGERVVIDVKGNGFLYNMVRILTGTLLEVGRGRMPKEAVPAILAGKDRALAGPTAPAKGLTLVEVFY